MPVPRTRRALAVAGPLACLLLSACAPAQDGRAASSAQPSTSAARSTSSAPSSWDNATYDVTCDALLSGKLPAKLVDGAAKVPVDVSESPYYDYLDVHLEGQATGDVDGDGKPDTVVLLQCWPQPSNGFVEEVHVFRADGSELGVLPSPQDLPETTILAPLYVPDGLAVQQGEIVAPMKAYGPNDSHATGPSVPFTVRWRWTGTNFVRVQ